MQQLRRLRLREEAELGPQAQGIPETQWGSPGTVLCQAWSWPDAEHQSPSLLAHSPHPLGPFSTPTLGLFLTRKALGAFM